MRHRPLAFLTAVALTASLGTGCASRADDGPVKAQPTGPIGTAEKTTVKIGMRLPNLDTNAPVEIAIDKGYYKQEGLTVQRIEAQSIREGLVGGSLDFGVEAALDVVTAARSGTGLRVVAGWRNREPYVVAVQPGISKPEDLSGKPVLLGANPGTIEYDVRVQLLKDAGFDISKVRVKPVNLPGGSNAWVEQFKQKKLAMTVVFPRHKKPVQEAGGRIVLDVMKEWPNDVLTAKQSFIAKNPNTTARFLRATLKAMKVWKDPAQQAYVQALMQKKGFTVTPLEKQPDVYANGPQLYDADMGLDPKGFDTLLSTLKLPPSKFGSYTDLVQLGRAQREAGVKARP
ncbi:ABC transporter substrate-binding protein [Actinomadura barringtoniae]|uniref:ABC transporter substrate-binding protein n=1 Tax=Actinomadura barringtoniae TaxID=1427535 RepID=A0A939T861_9ACTN|nr:ABC transporter substrate-binding protein [Actinomadura barringtoniae]MBO2449992.1 ABC transporter substrate-binding protein [Actinomadura barringtoniae]